MNDDFLKSEGPYQFKKTGHEKYELRAPIPTGEDGHFARSCPDSECSPGYFRVREGTGLTGDEYTRAFCPYCRREADPSDFITEKQRDYLESIVARQATKGLTDMLHDALGVKPGRPKRMGGSFLSMELSVKSSPLPPVRIPREEELRREVACPSCGLEHHVFGLATWCPDCGRDIFLAHLANELQVLTTMLDDVHRRRTELGRRFAARDLENTLEDLVSTFEAVLKFVTRRKLAESLSPEEVSIKLNRIGNAYQSISRGRVALRDYLGLDLFEKVGDNRIADLEHTFEKRHPITHNLGVVDRKYIERAMSEEAEGREVSVTEQELRSSIQFSESVLVSLYTRTFPESVDPSEQP